MKKKLFAALMVMAVAMPLIGSTPAQATKAYPGTLFTDSTGKVDANKPANGAKKESAPWAYLPSWPTLSGTVNSVGGHFHILFPITGTQQKVSLTNIDATYSEDNCEEGKAGGSLFVNIGEDKTPGLDDLHNNNRKELNVEYTFNYQRVGSTAVFNATRVTSSAKGQDQIQAELAFVPKLTDANHSGSGARSAQQLAADCAAYGQGTGPSGGPLKVYFEIIQGTVTV